MQKKHNHHHHIGAISLIPLLLLALASQWSEIAMADDISRYESLADRSEQQLQLLDAEFQGMQRAYNLLRNGEERTSYKSMTAHYDAETYDSVFEKYESAENHTTALSQRIDAYRERVNALGEKAFHISIAKQEASLVENGSIIARYPISSGKWETPTPTGQFQIHRKQTLRVSSQAVPYRMPHYMAFTKSQSHGFHALPYLGNKATNSDYWYEALDHIGTPASHGCVRLLPENAETVYEWIEVGTPVYINS